MKTSLQRIKTASNKRKDNISKHVAENFGTENVQVSVHKGCISTYTSKTHINREKKRKSEENETSMNEEIRKKSRKDTQFDFRKHCLFCPEIKEFMLPSEYDKKVPLHRRIPAYVVRSVIKLSQDANGNMLKKQGKKYKEYILEICDMRDDSLGRTVKARVLSALSDLHAADARYHHPCSIKLFDTRAFSRDNDGSSVAATVNDSILYPRAENKPATRDKAPASFSSKIEMI